MGATESQITSLTIVFSTVYSDADQNETSKLRITGLCAGNSPGTGEFPAQTAIYAENVSIWWRHHDETISCKDEVPAVTMFPTVVALLSISKTYLHILNI